MFNNFSKLLVVLFFLMNQEMIQAKHILTNQTNTIATTMEDGYSATATWNISSDINVIGYLIYYGTSIDNRTNFLNVGNCNTTTIYGLLQGMTYYFCVTAYDKHGFESIPSNEVEYTVPVIDNSPITLQVKNVAMEIIIDFDATHGNVYNIQMTEDFKEWKTLSITNTFSGNIVIPMTDIEQHPHKFYRIVKN